MLDKNLAPVPSALLQIIISLGILTSLNLPKWQKKKIFVLVSALLPTFPPAQFLTLYNNLSVLTLDASLAVGKEYLKPPDPLPPPPVYPRCYLFYLCQRRPLPNLQLPLLTVQCPVVPYSTAAPLASALIICTLARHFPDSDTVPTPTPLTSRFLFKTKM